MRKPKFLTLFKFFIGWPFSLLALFFIFKFALPRIDLIQTNISSIQLPVLGIGLVCFFFYYFFRTVTWKQILQEKRHNIPLKEVAYLWSMSEVRRFIPGNIWSMVTKTVLFSEKNIDKKTLFSAMFIEGQHVILGTGIVALFSLPFVLYSLMPSSEFTNTLMKGITVLAILIVTGYIFNPVLLRKIKGKFTHLFVLAFPQFSPSTNARVLAISTLSYLFFSLGTYFTITSFVFLNPKMFIQLLGFFALSLLAGYMSLLTPMGLGVREGAMTYGLSKIMSLTSAGFAAIFARVTIIVGELIFLGFAYLWHNTKNKKILQMEQWIGKHKYEVTLAALIVIYITYFTVASIQRHVNFYTGRFDLGNMTQTVWNTAHGRIFLLTNPDGTEVTSRLAFHADYILVLLAPLYALWPNPRLLLIVQTVVIALGAVFVYLLAKKILRNKFVSIALAAAYLLNPGIQHTNLYDFHAVTLATTFLLGAFYFLIEKRWMWFLVFGILAALTKEQVWIILAIFGMFIIFSSIRDDHSERNQFKPGLIGYILSHKNLYGLLVFLVSAGVFYYLIWYAIPQSRGGSHFALSYYSDFGDKPSSIIKAIFFSPQKTIGTLLQLHRLLYLQQLLLPLGFLSIFGPLYLVFIGPELLISLLSNNSQLHQIYYQYSATITPFLFISAIFGVKNIKKVFPKISLALVGILVVCASLYSAYDYGPLPGAKNPNINMFIKLQPNRTIMNKVLRNIPKNYSVAATNNLGSHLSNREKIFTIPIGIDKADVIAFLLDDPFAQPSPAAQRKMVENLKQNKNYFVLFEKDNFVVFQKILD